MNCDEIRDLSAEFALGTLNARERREASLHLDGCVTCRLELERVTALSNELFALAPNVEPPVGFEQRVLDKIAPTLVARHSKTPRRLVFAAAALMVLLLGSLGVINASRPSEGSDLHEAAFTSNSVTVGDAYFYAGKPSWMFMTVNNANNSGTVHCQIITANNKTYDVGTFELADGHGSWGYATPAGAAEPKAARLVDNSGAVIATATFI